RQAANVIERRHVIPIVAGRSLVTEPGCVPLRRTGCAARLSPSSRAGRASGTPSEQGGPAAQAIRPARSLAGVAWYPPPVLEPVRRPAEVRTSHGEHQEPE